MALIPLPDRLTIYHTPEFGDTDPPDWLPSDTLGLRGRITSMTNTQALTANAAGEYSPLATHMLRAEPSADLMISALVRRHSDDRCYLVMSVRESNRRSAAGRPDHVICDISIMDDPPPLPDALTQERRDR